SPWQALQVSVLPSYQAFQAVSSPVCSASKPDNCKPVPKQPVHQPCLELYENMRGSGSGKLVPQLGQARFTEKCFCSGSGRGPALRRSSSVEASSGVRSSSTLKLPWPCSSALRTASRNSASWRGSTS